MTILFIKHYFYFGLSFFSLLLEFNSIGLNCLVVDMESGKNKKIILDSLLSRQKSFYEETFLAPLRLFPRGYLLLWKKHFKI